MSWTSFALLVTGCVAWMAGYFRFIGDAQGNIDLNYCRFTGALGKMLTGLANGTIDLMSRDWTDQAESAALMIGGAATFALGVWSL